MSMAKPALKISITTGDTDGVGLEVSEKALLKIGPQKGVHFLLWRSPRSFPKNLHRLKKKFQLVCFEDPEQALTFLSSDKMKSGLLVELVSPLSPALWVEQS